ncbi:alpha/beta hydrolase-fold protein [Cellulomonas septica]|uniref:Esterase n=1 Tax=Cellulomonas septica TaxID=285080 RepID=A0ABX1K357_9CELL|nr:hypothetical protein [Cellulomonas septica]
MSVPGVHLPTQLDPEVVRAVAGRRDAISSWWTVGALLVVAAFLVLVAVRRRRRRHGGGGDGASEGDDGAPATDGAATRRPTKRRRRAWPFVTAATLVTVVALAVAANAFSGYVPNVAGLGLYVGFGGAGPRPGPTASVVPSPGATVATVASPPPTGHGRLVETTIAAPADLRVPTSTTYLYTPPGYDDSGRTLYPLVMLLHGAPGTSQAWFGNGIARTLDALITSGQLRPVIVVTPDTNGTGTDDTGCLDSTQGGSEVESYLEDVVVPWADDHYPTSRDWRYGAVGGMSAGAYCALDQGLRHVDRYGTILAIMPYDSPGSSGVDQLGADGDLAAHTPSRYLPTLDLPHPVAVFLADGDEEDVAEVRRARTDLTAALRARGQTVVTRIVPGGHDWNTAAEAIPYGLVFWEQQMRAADAAGAP